MRETPAHFDLERFEEEVDCECGQYPRGTCDLCLEARRKESLKESWATEAETIPTPKVAKRSPSKSKKQPKPAGPAIKTYGQEVELSKQEGGLKLDPKTLASWNEAKEKYGPKQN
jgi:hypothetical protein